MDRFRVSDVRNQCQANRDQQYAADDHQDSQGKLF